MFVTNGVLDALRGWAAASDSALGRWPPNKIRYPYGPRVECVLSRPSGSALFHIGVGGESAVRIGSLQICASHRSSLDRRSAMDAFRAPAVPSQGLD